MEFQEVLFSAMSIVLTALATWAAERLIAWLNTKIKDEKYRKYLTEATDTATRIVKVTYQTYVEALKGQNAFTEDAQKKALSQAKSVIIDQLSKEAKVFVEKNYSNVENWIELLIESIIYDLKNQPKNVE